MDEYEDNFRIVTTTGDSWQDTSLNHLYILDKNLEIIGKVEGLAQGERIYSSRFLGDKLYLVTFRQVDPFFVIDLSNPEKPEILGYLKIPGYSSYLHPYDEAHIIGIGQDDRNLKISLFDVSDFTNPEETAKYSVNEDYSYSDALYDHKAFLFDKEKELLVIPVSYNSYQKIEGREWQYWQGAFVFKMNADEIILRGKITHHESEEMWDDYVRRTLYIDDALYTISSSFVKANNLGTLAPISQVDLGYEEPNILYEETVVSQNVK